MNILSSKGLTKLQMVLALVMVFIFAGLSVPKIIDITRKTAEGETKYNLGRLRSAVAAYYGDNRGNYPEDDLTVLVPRYIEKMPFNAAPGREKSNKVYTGAEVNYKGGWFYFNDRNSPRWGDVAANIPGKDSAGKDWAEN